MDAQISAVSPAPSAGEPHLRSHRARGGRGRSGQRRGANQARDRPRGQATPVSQDSGELEPPPTVASRGGPTSSASNGRAGRGRRGGRNPARGGAELSQRTNAGTRRSFGGHLSSDAQLEAEPAGSAAAAALSADAPEFVPGRPVAGKKGKQPLQAKATVTRTESKSTAPDLVTRIHEDITNGQYECVICTNEVLRNSRVWSCSICWTVAHMSCVRKWYSNQMKKSDQPEGQAPKGWRCPGCNSAMAEEPMSYHCWCGKELNPQSIPGLPPHSCNQTCAKPRPTCPHPCGLVCHAGPCPPCQLMGPSISCFCGKNMSTKRCAETDYAHGFSCGEICGDTLPCGEHECQQPCHPGLCGGCGIPIHSLCYCGKEQREIPCELRGDPVASFNHGQVQQLPSEDPKSEFDGTFGCDRTCNRLFDCGIHKCQRSCHSQDEAGTHCPSSPDIVTHCPCGKSQLSEILDQPRTSCTEPIPTCAKTCDKLLDCGHRCLAGCHDSSCPPCLQKMDVTCRCGRMTTPTLCHQGTVYTPECMRVCRAQLNCGRHSHDLHCCPGERKAIERTAARRKRKNLGTTTDEVEAEHICLRICGRNLKCGKHTCTQICHSGACATCPEAIFEEISCHCGRTELSPPQPCGTQPPECRHECTRPSPACGHPRVQHTCHTDDKPCPPCPFLVEKLCICGKKTLKNQPCWFEEARCGLPCGKTLKCGTHKCTKSCHRQGDCEDSGVRGSHCTQPCLKAKKHCEHVDTDRCHAPSACKEDKPCQAKTFVTCECQHRKQEVKCLASSLNSSPERPPLKCDDECLQLQRNARLAAALNIDPETHADNHVPYSDKTLQLFKSSVKWSQTQEREFRVFASELDEKRLRFKPMKPQQRAFLHALAKDYGLDSESQDPEPHRHVSVFKTPRFVSAPTKTLAQCVKTRPADGAAADTATAPPALPTEPYNALLLTSPRFGLTVEELESVLKKDLASQPTVSFTISFLPADEVVLKGSGFWAAQALESAIVTLKPAVSKTATSQDLAKAVFLCSVDVSLNVLRREVDPTKNANGWSSVVSRSAARQAKFSSAAGPSTAEPPVAPRKFMALKKEPKKKMAAEPVDEDWEAAAEKIAEE